MTEEIKVITESNSFISGDGSSSLEDKVFFYNSLGGVEVGNSSRACAFPFYITEKIYLTPIRTNQIEKLDQCTEHSSSERSPTGLHKREIVIQTIDFSDFYALIKSLPTEEVKTPNLKESWKKLESNLWRNYKINEFLDDVYQFLQNR